MSRRTSLFQTSSDRKAWQRKLYNKNWIRLSYDLKNYTDLRGSYLPQPITPAYICRIRGGGGRSTFLERCGNFSGPKAKFKIKTCSIVAQLLALKPLKFASLTESFNASFSKHVIETVILNANMSNIKQLFNPEKLPGLSRNRPQGP